ncbi:hypothetical protein PWR66_05405 [Paraburkholderia sp. A1RO-5]|uniref:hypothetical protein n=1 Tax=Paraburkholderia sp. A1RO-5 TaxID=3028369 RepID=UPI003B771B82
MKKETEFAQKRTILEIDGELCEPGPEDIAARAAMFKDYRSEIDKRHISNAENFDKAILTYANAGLGLSITLFKDAFSGATTLGQCLLGGSWAAFTLAVLAVIASFLISQRVLMDQIARAERILIRFDDSAARGAGLERYSNAATWCAGLFFAVGVVGTFLFAVLSYQAPGSGGLSRNSAHSAVSAGARR